MKELKFDRQKPYNNLPLLPPCKDIDNNPAILKRLVSASRALATVNGNLNRLPNPLMLINTLALQEAKTSTEIENIFTTEDELYKAISDTHKDSNIKPATKEVLKYREALWAGFKELQINQKIDTKLITQIFNQIKETTSGYRPPQAQVVIKRGESDFRSGEIVYTPPRAEGLIEIFMENLVDYLNDDHLFPADPLLKMCVAHYQFEAIHPFQDGNGRTGRILNLLYLFSKGLLSQPVLYMSKFIIQNKEDYYFKLGAVTQRNSWEPWIEFMLEATEKTSILTNIRINEILAQMDATLEYAKGKIKWYNKEVNEAIFSQPYIKPSVIGEIIGKSSRTTLTKYVNELVNNNILRPKKDGVEVYYVNDDLIRILEG
ncbi:Fic family protein [Saccharicrinis carchari]|uniref:Fic family protein n=1 Tax=Saccharicrinis carchari TaxID=1168039 RepID=A0A521AK44_SACCC|nr:Fic family protein [Saccharicrinis carchari]SMO35204.1 Fic family protein [Saccharicrinis carchari]